MKLSTKTTDRQRAHRPTPLIATDVWDEAQHNILEWRRFERSVNTPEGITGFERICAADSLGIHVVRVGPFWAHNSAGEPYYCGILVTCAHCGAHVVLHPGHAIQALLRAAQGEGLIRSLPLMRVEE